MTFNHDKFDENFDETALDLGDDTTPAVSEIEEPAAEPTQQSTDNAAPAAPAPADATQPAEAPASATTTTDDHQPDERGSIYIPKKRFDEVVSQRNDAALERDTLAEQVRLMQNYVRQLQAQQQQPQQAPQQPQQTQQQQQAQDQGDAQMRDLRRAYNQSLIDGDLDQADKVMDAMDALRRRQIEQSIINQTVNQTRAMTADEADMREYNTRLSTYVQQNPVFDENSPYYDAEIANQALEVGKALIQSGMTRTQALDRIISIFSPTAQQRMAQFAPPATAAAPAQPQTINRAPAKTGVQPPAIHTTGGTGKSNPKYDTSAMTIEDFERLSEDEIAKILEQS